MNGKVRLVAMAASLAVLAGCGFKGASSLPLPGGAAHGKTYHVTAYFNDVQDLTVQAAVRVNDVAEGDVTSINVDPKTLQAKVGLKVNSSVQLPRNAVATLEQSTLLGEKFISLAPPTNAAPEGRLGDGDTIEQPSTTELPSVEQVFSLLSNVLNGGDLADLQTITIEISKALQGRESAVRGALAQLNTFVSGLASQKHQVVQALTQLNRFSGQLAKQNSTIATALTDLGPGLRVLANERAQFVSLLSHLSTLGKVATRVINSSKADTIAGLRDLQPILRHLAAAGADLPKALEILITFPFPRDSGAAAPGDFNNVEFTLNLAPVLCSAIATYSPAQLAKLLTPLEDAVVKLLTSNSCPVAGSVTSPLGSTPSHSRSAGGQSAGSSPSDGSAGRGSGPTPSPSPSGGLGGLLQGLLGGLAR